MGTLQVGGTTLGVKNTSTNKVDLSNAGDVNISGDITKDSLPMYACRAWVNFDGTKDTSGATSADTTNRLIRGSGNVASVLRNGTGDYTITFTTPMPDANYCISGAGGRDSTGGGERYVSIGYLTTTSFRYWTHVDSTQAIDAENVCASVFR
jgi:hypothetical protein